MHLNSWNYCMLEFAVVNAAPSQGYDVMLRLVWLLEV